MSLMDKLLKRLKEEGIPTYSMSESQLKKANEILSELTQTDCCIICGDEATEVRQGQPYCNECCN